MRGNLSFCLMFPRFKMKDAYILSWISEIFQLLFILPQTRLSVTFKLRPFWKVLEHAVKFSCIYIYICATKRFHLLIDLNNLINVRKLCFDRKRNKSKMLFYANKSFEVYLGCVKTVFVRSMPYKNVSNFELHEFVSKNAYLSNHTKLSCYTFTS